MSVGRALLPETVRVVMTAEVQIAQGVTAQEVMIAGIVLIALIVHVARIVNQVEVAKRKATVVIVAAKEAAESPLPQLLQKESTLIRPLA